MQTFNEGKACDAIVRYLEKAREHPARGACAGLKMRAIRFPSNCYLLSAPNFSRSNIRGLNLSRATSRWTPKAPRLFKTHHRRIETALSVRPRYSSSSSPRMRFRGMRMPEVRKRPACHYRLGEAGRTNSAPGDVMPIIEARPFVRLPSPECPSPYRSTALSQHWCRAITFRSSHLVGNGEQARTDRIREAVEKKFPKLAAWKARPQCEKHLDLRRQRHSTHEPGDCDRSLLAARHGEVGQAGTRHISSLLAWTHGTHGRF